MDQTQRHIGGSLLKLAIVPIALDEANAFVREHHRHHAPVPGAKFCVAVASGEAVVGVAIVGRPVARMVDDGWTLEVNRTCTDGTKNANSALYGACRRVAFGLGYRRLITYTLPEEGGTSLRAAGWKCLGEAGGGKWSRKGRMSDTRLQTEARELIAFYDERGWNWESALGFVLCRELFSHNFLIIDRTEFDVRKKRRSNR